MKKICRIISCLLIAAVLIGSFPSMSVKANEKVGEEPLRIEIQDNVEEGTDIYAGDEIVLTVAANGGAGNYVFQYLDTTGKILQDYTEGNQYSFLAEAGENAVTVNVKDAEGNVETAEYKRTVVDLNDGSGQDENTGNETDSSSDVEKGQLESDEKDVTEDTDTDKVVSENLDQVEELSSLEVSISSSKTENEYVDRSVTLTGQVTGGNGALQYRYTEVYNGKETIRKDYNESPKYSFITSGIGTHVYYLDVKDENGNEARAEYSMNVVAHPDNVLTGKITSNKTANEYVNRSVTLTAVTTGGYGEVEYRFTESYNGKTTVLQEYAANNQYKFNTTNPGTHTYYVEIRDEEGQYKKLSYKLNVVAHPDYVLTGKITSNKTANEYVNRSVTLTAVTTGGYGEVEYRFTESYNGKTTVLQEYAANNQYKFNTTNPGTHTYYVEIRDEEGQYKKLSYKLNVVAHPDNVLTGKITSNKTANEYVNRSVTLTAAATGGYGEVEYRFTESYNGKTTVLQEYAANNQYKFNTTNPGTHTYYVEIRDEEGQYKKLSYKMNVVVHPDYVLTGKITSNKTANEYVNRSVTLTAASTGGYGEVEYRFTESYNGKTTVLQEYAANNRYKFNTTNPGTHTYYVEIRDEEGQYKKLSYKMNVVVHPDYVLTGRITSNKTANEYVNRSVTLTAVSTGGYGEVEYRFTESYDGKTTVLREYSTDNKYQFRTTNPGTHTYYVEIRDEEGQYKKLSYKQNVAVHPDYVIKGKVTSNKTTNEYVNRSVTLAAVATGGYGKLQYKFTESYNGSTWVRENYSETNTYKFTTTGVGTHTFYIDIKDSEGQVVRLTYKQTVSVHPDYKLKGTFTTSPSGTATPGQRVTLKASSSGGYSSTHQYRFREVYNGRTTVLQNYSSSKTCTTTVSGGGTHTYYVDIKDSEGQVLTLSRTISTSLAYTYAANVLNQVGWNLRAAFNWSASLPYETYSYSPAPGSENMALYGFQNGRGDCYVMAATFYYMAKTLGYDAHQMAGYVPLLNGGRGVHSWVEIDMNGTTYVFDPDFTKETGRNGYQITYGTSGTWVYSDYYRMN